MNDPRRPAALDNDTARLAALADTLRASAAQRDLAGGHAAREKQLIADAGLLTLAVPREFGGDGASWPHIYETIRTLARVDSALAHLLGFEALQVVSVDVWGNAAQRERYLRGTVENRWWWGNAVNPLDTRLVAQPGADGCVRLFGKKGFCSGTYGSQMMTISAHDPATGKPIFAVVPTTRAGITVHDDWDPIGQRQTDSGTVSFDDVEVRADEVLHRSETPPRPRATLRTLVSQLVLTNLFVGIAEGALEEARQYVLENGRPWVNSGVAQAIDDPYLQQRFGEMRVSSLSAALLADRAAGLLDDAWNRGESLDAATRATVALAVSEAKIVAHRAALQVGEQLFDACGARSTNAALAFDRFWRNARVHTLHDPLDYRVRDVGRYVLTRDLPEPTLYT
ncbi:acyl-CoA dehydrogenase family protein [Paraburkholderia caballeronis]|uniref:Acyl-CoA dehydrogenase n=1 Tax=Paraburkholderia caballeronis TaxID=416943 RepID=A0A1H7QIU8_9BURK|nr:acyl-CoA dehydrogenase family protein [Paraburkholderia caballeronis]PXW22550.1 alkylation response protein AidB-like acyl-CoA dehydrogenase [Paraburkholderia caballeronis]PXW96421.1 alkylation response protein AidB-like acyl-CoA dehydrogenase [Paraburkholderia caballeronis]RAJ92832.1 alkylation response protein AidB-like acyl-CoA dehydrogenase [Paraburkholderia caballeronis]SEE06109.1 Acyl-CoA dehydrogenase [Paraburkholderia caballeronis]SEL47515.1 Acyl-CoA dehydrogenase [Paraburkholderia 